jgi:hypothetical protein
VDGILGHNLLLSRAFWWESLRGWDFRPQLIVVSSLFGGNPFVDGILGHNILLSRASFHNLFFFSRWNSGYQEAFLTNFSFFTIEFWLSGSLSHGLFFFHDGILAIRKPFSRTFLFSRWNFGYHEAFLTNFFFTMEFWLSGSLSHELFFFHDGILAIRMPFSRTFIIVLQWNSVKTRFKGRLFSYIYRKEYLHRIRLVKNLVS